MQNINSQPQQHVSAAPINFATTNTQDDPLTIIAQQLRRLFTEQGDGPHFEKLESLIVHQAFAYVRSNQVHGAALLGISRNVMRTLLKRHGLLTDNYSGRNSDEDEAHIFVNELQAG